MRKPGFGEINMGAVAGATVGAIGGLFGIGLVPAIVTGDPAVLIAAPFFSFLCFLVSGCTGWVLGGQIGPRAALRSAHPRAEIVGGGLGGLLPVVLIVLWGWYLVSR